MSFRLPRTVPLLTIFHNPANSASKQALQLLKKASVEHDFKVDVVDASAAPTHQQVSNIVEFLAKTEKISVPQSCQRILTSGAPSVSTVGQVQKLLDKDPKLFVTPLIVDWNKGKAIIPNFLI
ncbi:hypothetical protein DFQ27_005444 [Actinomortierella ambigua]|uniref:Uncharacterized protein n=1 Tax=Actinomortierella ambigua TaxID=1343610 RepID=A0A9P6Q0X1_9FUNG|nr:hypothetical protein DFQ27_005444 [Actinomortierella ambigua]